MNLFFIYFSEFLLIMIGYLLSWIFISVPPVSKEETADFPWIVQGLPFYYQWRFIYQTLILRLSKLLGPFLRDILPKDIAAKINAMLKVAGVKLSLEVFMTSQIVFASIIALPIYFNSVFIIQNWFLGLEAGVFIWLVIFFYPLLLIRQKGMKRQQIIIKTLPFAIDLIGSAMSSGQDFMAAVRFYVNNEEEANPLVQEFSQVLRDMSGGISREEAMKSMADRVQIASFSTFVAAVVHGEKAGTSIVRTLKNQGSMLRRERFALAQQKAEKAGTLILLPIGLLLLAFIGILGYPLWALMQKNSGF